MNGPTVIRHGYVHARFSVESRKVCRRKLGASVQDDREGTWRSSCDQRAAFPKFHALMGLINHFRSVQYIPLLFILGLILDLKFMFLSSLRFVFQFWLSIVLPCRVALPWWAHQCEPLRSGMIFFQWWRQPFGEDSFFQIPRDSDCLYEDLKERPVSVTNIF